MLQGDEVALSGRSQQEAVGRCSLAVGDGIGIGSRQQDARQHLALVHRDRAVELAVGRVVEEVEPALLGGRVVRVLVEDLVVEAGLDGAVGRGAAQERRHGPGFAAVPWRPRCP